MMSLMIGIIAIFIFAIVYGIKVDAEMKTMEKDLLEKLKLNK